MTYGCGASRLQLTLFQFCCILVSWVRLLVPLLIVLNLLWQDVHGRDRDEHATCERICDTESGYVLAESLALDGQHADEKGFEESHKYKYDIDVAGA